MGFFKKIGTAIKKNVSFKNLVKVATTAVGFVPGFGGIAQQAIEKVTDAVEANKQEKRALAEGKVDEANAWAIKAQQLKQQLADASGAVAGAGANIFGKAIVTGVNDGLSSGIIQNSGQIGATVVSSTIKVWFERNWKIVVGAVAGLIALIWFLRRGNNHSGQRVAKRR
ncbi:hypothetical protein D0817_19260 [Flavobacterium cupreum]|uniref:Uncharacterized protein n=2 Tax=Flavobacterium TaxID=237 RepID=A0A4Y7U9J7_9FLAO|nr:MULTISPECIES: hypothetical protein [Flavobacterium]RUT68756.1 hypothetical protein D0817_19260 [Flavobacterium cupreum]TCN55496.1 hypothetical protein EV142_106185 [Flavobacterium circumlabens]TEB43095.1 hypothetical protein D0809_16810 [Flavobacterium circumlabens]